MSRRRRFGTGILAICALVVSAFVAVPANANATGAIAGTVTDLAGAPLAGVNVVIREQIRFDVDTFSSIEVARATTDSRGKYRVSGLRGGAKFWVEFQPASDRHAFELWKNSHNPADASLVDLSANNQATGIDSRLEDAASVSGRVSSSLHSGLSGQNVKVRVYRRADSDQKSFELIEHFNSETNTVNEDGTYKIAGLPHGVYKIRFVADGQLLSQYFGGSFDAEGAQVVIVGAAENVTVGETRLHRAATISGTASLPPNAPTRESYGKGDIRVTAYKRDVKSSEFQWYSSVDTSTGEYSIRNMHPGTYRLEYTSLYPGYFQPEYWGGGRALVEAKDIVVAEADHLANMNVRFGRFSQDNRLFCDVDSPTINGALRVGSTLSVSGGTWRDFSDAEETNTYCDDAKATYTYRWSFVENLFGDDKSYFAETTTNSLVIPAEASGKKISVHVLAANPGVYYGSVTSAQTEGRVTPVAVEKPQVKFSSSIVAKVKTKKKRKVEFDVAVRANKKAAGGNVVVYRGAKKLKTVKLNKSGKANVKLSKQPKGTQTYVLRYSGSVKTQPNAKSVKVRTKK